MIPDFKLGQTLFLLTTEKKKLQLALIMQKKRELFFLVVECCLVFKQKLSFKGSLLLFLKKIICSMIMIQWIQVVLLFSLSFELSYLSSAFFFKLGIIQDKTSHKLFFPLNFEVNSIFSPAESVMIDFYFKINFFRKVKVKKKKILFLL